MSNVELVSAVENAIERYEELIGRHASRTREVIDRYGYVPALSRLVVSADLQSGFKMLRDRGELDLTFEAIVVRFHEQFEPRIVEAARFRLENAQEL